MNKGNESCKLVLEHRRGKKRLLTGSGKMLLKQCCSNGTLKGHWYHPIDILGRISLQNKIGRKTKHRKNTLSTHRVPVRREMRARLSRALGNKPRISCQATMLPQQCSRTDLSLQQNQSLGGIVETQAPHL